MNALERTLLIERIAAWLGPALYDARFDDDYCRVFTRVTDASLGAVPESSSTEAQLDHLPTRWATFTAVADAMARRWTADQRDPEPRMLVWPSAAVASRIQGLSGSVMRPALDLNRASAGELAALPGLGPTTAARIVARRAAEGAFASIDDLRGIRGLSKADRDKAAAFLTIVAAAPAAVLRHPQLGEHDGILDFPTLIVVMHASGLLFAGTEPESGAPQLSAAGRALAELQRLAETCRREPFWERDRRADIGAMRLAAAAALRTDALNDRPRRPATVGVVRNSGYLALAVGLIERAQTQVLVQMFFLTSPGTTSPGDKLIDAMTAAVARGVDVRLILDTDLEDDYHGASRVNAESLARLDASGLSYRLDELGTTSHSKVMLVDGDQMLIGSHNWTTSAMYLLDETSLYVESVPLAAEQRARFEQLWRRYDPDPDRRDLHFSLVAYLKPFERRRLADAGYTGSRAFLDALANVRAVDGQAAETTLEPARLRRLWRLLKLMHAFGFPEATAFALTLTPVDSPSEFRRIARKRTLRYLRALDPLPEPYSRRQIRFDVVEAADA
jgi:PLD-like domain/Helix-hairpin-helix motif